MFVQSADSRSPGKLGMAVAGLIFAILCSSSAIWSADYRRFGSERDFGPSPDDYVTRYRPDRQDRFPELFPAEPSPSRSPSREPAPPVHVSPPQPTLNQKITQRYQDPRVIRVLTELTSQKGEGFFREVSQMIDTRHIEPTSYAERIDMGFEHLKIALNNSAFRQAAGINPTPQQVLSLQTQLDTMQRQVVVRDVNDAVMAARQVGQLSQRTVGLNPGAVCFEFVYASLDTLDKFSMFLPPERTGQVDVGLNDQLVGIGVEVETNPAGLRIVRAFAGGPAADATLRKGDLITAVDGRALRGLEFSRAVDLIAGPASSPVKLSLRRDNLIADITLIRRAVQINSVSEVRMLDQAPGVGYIKLDQFAESSAEEMDAALWKLYESGMESLVLDLRGNPGGYLTTAIELSDRFLPSGTIVSTHGRNADDNSRESANHAQTWKIPLVVLVDHGSASASEIFAAAIQENGRGLIVGETSYGKGTVQTLFPLLSVSAGLRLTTAKFYSPDGREMAGVGVSPDVTVRTGSADDDAAMLQAAVETTRDPRLQMMANRLNRPGRTGMRVIQVAATQSK